MSRSEHFDLGKSEGDPAPEIKFFTADKYPDIPDNVRVSMERAKNAVDARRAREAEEKGMLPGSNPDNDHVGPVCDDCNRPLKVKPILRRGKRPLVQHTCTKCDYSRILGQ